MRREYDVLLTTQTQLLGALHAARATATFERKFQSLARVALLIIDDFCLKPLRPSQDEDLHDLIAKRYVQAATIVASNLVFAECDAFPNRLLGVATLDRLRHRDYRVILDGESYRASRPLPHGPKIITCKTSQKREIITPVRDPTGPLSSGSINPVRGSSIRADKINPTVGRAENLPGVYQNSSFRPMRVLCSQRRGGLPHHPPPPPTVRAAAAVLVRLNRQVRLFVAVIEVKSGDLHVFQA